MPAEKIEMRILWFSYYYVPHVGGGTWATYSLSSLLSKKGHKVCVITPNIRFSLSVSSEVAQYMDKENPSRIYRASRIPIPRALGPLLGMFSMFFAGLRFGKSADIIIAQYHPHYLLTPVVIALGRIFNVPIVLRACDVWREMGVKDPSFRARDLFAKIMNALNEPLIRFATTFLVVCSDHREILMTRMQGRHPPCQIRLSYNGFDSHEFNDVLSKEDARKSLGIGLDERTLLCVGRFSGAEYGTEVLLRAFSMLLRKQPDSLLFLIGDQMSRLQWALAESLGIHENIKVYGPMAHEKVVDFIAAADVCVGPLMATQTMPLKVLEYMACGKPIVTGARSTTVDLNPDINFLIVPPQPNIISEAFLKVLQDHSYAGMLGSNAKKAATRFSWEKVAQSLEQVLYEAFERRHEDPRGCKRR